MHYLGQRAAQALDVELMSATGGGFCLEQLMELAGLAVAEVVTKVFPVERHPQVLVCCGPGNNGGDGLVAARHLAHFGYTPRIYCPKRSKNPHFSALHRQLEQLGVKEVEANLTEAIHTSDVIVDALFGFSFSGTVRPPFDEALKSLSHPSVGERILSVDMPSGWDVEKGPVGDAPLRPSILVSLTWPKEGASHHLGPHYLGGRFVPRAMLEAYGIPPAAIPTFRLAEQSTLLPSAKAEGR